MLMLSLSNIVLLVSMGGMRHDGICQLGEKRNLSAHTLSQIRLHHNDFTIKQMLNKELKFKKVLKIFRFTAQQIDPYKFTIVFNETYKIFLAIKICNL
jgi:hypothetical protein